MHRNENAVSILVVEDDANTLNIIRDYLSRAGFAVRSAGNGWEALKRIKEGPVDAIIADLDIAETDGAGLREKILLNPGTRDIPFFYLTSDNKTDALVEALRSGVDDCISKPFDPLVLTTRVQAVLARRNALEQLVRLDPMTHLLNRSTLMKDLRQELDRVVRYRRPATILLMDLSDFVRANAENGALMGDLLLTCLAGIIINGIRSMDIAGRYRGECILIFLPETDEKGAEALVKRIQEKITLVADVVAGLSLTFSCGMVSAPRDGTEMDVLLSRLENAVRHAAQRQKGAICVWSPDIGESLKTNDVLPQA